MNLRFNRKQAIFITVVFTAIQLLILVGFYLLGSLIVSTAECPGSPGDPCDAAPMMAFALMFISVPVALLVGGIVTYIAYNIFMKE